MLIDHVGIAVRSIGHAVPQWESAFGYRQATEIVANTRQRVRVAFLSKDGSLSVKLIEPADPTSPIHVFAQRGGGLHHLCFMCDSVEDEVRRLESLGIRVLSRPQPGEAFENEKVAFVYAAGLNVELIDTYKRARRLHS